MTKAPGNPTRMDAAAFWAPSPIEIFHPGPSPEQRWAARMAKQRLEAAKAASEQAAELPDCYRWHTVEELLGR